MDCGGHTLQGDLTGNAIYIYGNSACKINNCIIDSFNRGIYFYYGYNHEVTNNTISNNVFTGIKIYNSNGSNFENNKIVSNGSYGIGLDFSDNNTFYRNETCYHSIFDCDINSSTGNSGDENTGDLLQGAWDDEGTTGFTYVCGGSVAFEADAVNGTVPFKVNFTNSKCPIGKW